MTQAAYDEKEKLFSEQMDLVAAQNDNAMIEMALNIAAFVTSLIPVLGKLPSLGLTLAAIVYTSARQADQ